MAGCKHVSCHPMQIELLGDSERRLSAENMALRKEAQQLNESLIKVRVGWRDGHEQAGGGGHNTFRKKVIVVM